MSSFFALPKPRLFGHRGCAASHPENTLVSFAAALEAGMGYLELDVWASRDGQVVVHHDETLTRTCGLERPITELTLEELRGADAGFNFTSDDGKSFPWRGRGIGIPTLAEVLREFPEARLNIEIKQQEPPIEELVVAEVRRAGAEQRVLLASEKDGVLQRLRPLCPQIPTNLGYGETHAFYTWLSGGCRGEYRPPGQALQIPPSFGGLNLVTPESVAAAHRLGLEMHIWTVNDAAQMLELLRLGVDGLMSDDAPLLLEMARQFAAETASEHP